MNATLKNIGFAALCFAFGLSFFYSIYNGPASQRDPASAGRKILQLSAMTPEEMQQQLRAKLRVQPTQNGEKTISFSGFSSAVCNTYSSVEMVFAAEGVAVAGEAPGMKISAPCTGATGEPGQMAAITLPVGQLLTEKPRNADYHYSGYAATMSFTNSADEWPRTWVLRTVEFKNNNGGENKTASFSRAPASVDTSEKPIVLEF